jgi:DNA-binding transcriptional regulator YdaS (Cro superfamily)
MSKRQMSRWIQSVGASAAAKKVGVSEVTVGRWLAGITRPRGNRLALVERAIKAWERSRK